jgi:hypothetical protein
VGFAGLSERGKAKNERRKRQFLLIPGFSPILPFLVSR